MSTFKISAIITLALMVITAISRFIPVYVVGVIGAFAYCCLWVFVPFTIFAALADDEE